MTQLALKADGLTGKGSFAAAADTFADALDAARALRKPDCHVVVADLCSMRANALFDGARDFCRPTRAQGSRRGAA